MKNRVEKQLALTLCFPKYVSYADCQMGTPLTVLAHNGGEEPLAAQISLEGSDLFVNARQEADIPYESAVSLSFGGVLSPLFLAENSSPRSCAAEVIARVGGREVCRRKREIVALPPDWWEGLSGNPARLAFFVRPHAKSMGVLARAAMRLKQKSFCGYAEKCEGVRQEISAIFSAIKGLRLVRAGEVDCAQPLPAAKEGITSGDRATALEAGVFACSCFEAAGLHPVLAVGRRSIGVGVWLYNTSFLEAVTDEGETVQKYRANGNLLLFDAEGLFGRGSLSNAQERFLEKLTKGEFECFVDICRCRREGIMPCPVRESAPRGLEIGGEEAVTLPVTVSAKRGEAKNKVWERELLDFSARNSLLNFTGRHALHILSDDLNALYLQLSSQGSMRLTEAAAGDFGEELKREEAQRIALEQSKGLLRAHSDEGLSSSAAHLIKKSREAEEETGAGILYFAFGLLYYGGERTPRRAPLVLVPATLKESKTGELTLALSSRDRHVNTTLLSHLKEEYGIEVGGAEEIAGRKLSEILALFRAKTVGRAGWHVEESAHLSTFSFRRFCLWNDLHSHFPEMEKNALVRALLHGRAEEQESAIPKQNRHLFLPLQTDSSQRSAIELADMGASFVLHGPPGTGKSQTIAGMIANALAKGKRVLFVAEKKAALDVVKSKLDQIGIGEFCLGLQSDKSEKEEVLTRLGETMGLASEEEPAGYFERREALERVKEELEAPTRALNEEKEQGISLLEGMGKYLERQAAPDVATVGSVLARQDFFEIRELFLAAVSAAKECGGVSASPLASVNLEEYCLEEREKIRLAAEVLLVETNRLKGFLSLLVGLFRQKLPALTVESAAALRSLLGELASGKYSHYFKGVSEEEFGRFFSVGRTLDEKMGYYLSHFKSLPKRGNGEGMRRRLARAALHPLNGEDEEKYLGMLGEIYAAMDELAASPLAAPFVSRGRIRFRRREEYLRGLKQLHARCGDIFADFDPENFNAACVNMENGGTMSALDGFKKAHSDYLAARESYLSAIRATDKSDVETLASEAEAILQNLDMLPAWCTYRNTVKELERRGVRLTRLFEQGNFGTQQLLAGLEKGVYRHFLAVNLKNFAVGAPEGTQEKFCLLQNELERFTRHHVRAMLTARLPREDETGPLAAEKGTFIRYAANGMRATSLRSFLAQIPNLAKRLAPCMLMSPTAVAQYLPCEHDMFDLVIFDEASQLPTAEAVGAIARAKQAIIVGDGNQLPPTPFFRAGHTDGDEESILDACLALGMPSRHLRWHYRSAHESLIAFSNNMFYGGRLCTLPSPDTESRVQLIKVNGTYDRGLTKQNRGEAEALVGEVVRRLSDPRQRGKSMGIVTFSSPQQELIERLLSARLAEENLKSAAYDRCEPLFVKNLENVQGDERDVILFSVCYGPDRAGRLSLGFGPLNRAGGWRRLNVAVTRAREEMLVFSTMTAAVIDLQRTHARGVAGLKAFLDYAEHGPAALAISPAAAKGDGSLKKHIAAALKQSGYSCRYNVGASDFKVDVAVLDPKTRRFVLGILLDGTFSAEERILQARAMERGGWKVLRLNPASYFLDPQRELMRIRRAMEGSGGAPCGWLARYKKPYRAVKLKGAQLITDEEICACLKEIVKVEQPISRPFLIKRLLMILGMSRGPALPRLNRLIDGCLFPCERIGDVDYFYHTARALAFNRVRMERGKPMRRGEDFTPYEVVSLVKGALEERGALYPDEISPLVAAALQLQPSGQLSAHLENCIAYGQKRGVFVRTPSDRLILAQFSQN